MPRPNTCSAALKTLLLAGSASLLLAACGGSTTSPGTSGPVTVNPPTGGGGTPAPSADIDLIGSSSCPIGLAEETLSNATGTVRVCTLSGTVTENLSLPSGLDIALSGPVFVGEDGGADVSLTIPAGTRVFGASGTDYLVVTRGSRLNVRGTASEPVVMTSIQDIQGTVDPVNDRGLWGGLVINGFAPINDCIDATATGGSASCEKSGEGSSGLFGGDNPTDNSGTLQYLQVKYAGNLINDEDELNGIAFQGVGSNTTCEYVQVHNNADDGVEFFGGTVQCDYLVLTGIGDDSLDWTDGWQGGAQFVIVQQTAGAGDRGIEGDNRSSNNELDPTSSPTIANFTFLGGPDADSGIVIRAGTEAALYNGIITGFPDAGFDIDDQATFDEFAAGDIAVASHFFDNADNIEIEDGDPLTAADYAALPDVVTGNNSLTDTYFPGASEQAVPAFDLAATPGFEAVDYIGAFSPTETPENNWASGWTFGLFDDVASNECPRGTLSTGDVVGGRSICSISGTITENVRLSNRFVYQLEGAVFVGEDVGGDAAAPNADAATAILTIDAGTTLYGATGTDYLVVSRGSQLRSNGTRTAPVIMTSRAEVFGTADLANDRGLWGGLVINGRAPINDCIDATAAGGTAACEKSGEGSSGLFGGNDPEDNSGNLLFTRVSFAGNLINDEDELNGIAFQGVGSGTQVDYVQVHNNVDDGVEFFGGTVDVRHLVLTGIGDDSMDWTDGWQGRAQFVIVDQADDAGDRGIEGDNRSSNETLTPTSSPVISNLTFVGGAGGDTGAVLRAGTRASLYNGIITGFQDAGVDLDGTQTPVEATNGNVTFDSMLVVGNAENLETDGDAGDAPLAAAFAAGSNNVTTGTTVVADEQYVPGATAAAVPFTDPGDAFFETVDYIGAVRDADDDWYRGWTLLVDQ